MTLLSVRGLTKAFGATPVFANVSFEIGAGEVVALLGESGVGKSTLLNCIAGLERADAGELRLQGEALPLADESALAHWRRAHLGFVFQAFHVLPHPSVAENVALPLLLLGRPEPQRLAAMLDAVGLADARGLWVNPRGGGPDSFGLQGRVGPGLASR